MLLGPLGHATVRLPLVSLPLVSVVSVFFVTLYPLQSVLLELSDGPSAYSSRSPVDTPCHFARARPWVACSVLRVACGPSFRVVPCRFAVSPVGFAGPRAGSRELIGTVN